MIELYLFFKLECSLDSFAILSLYTPHYHIDSMKILVFGDINGEVDSFYQKLASLHRWLLLSPALTYCFVDQRQVHLIAVL